MGREVVDLLTETNAEDWPAAGPHTLSRCARFLKRRSRGLLDWHRLWRSTVKLGKQCWRVESHELGLRQSERAVCCDGLDICNCACWEDVVRQVHGVESAYIQRHQDNKEKGKGRFGISEEAALFARTHRLSGGHMVCPDLLDFVSQEVETDASIMKQIREAREERHVAQKNKKGGA